MNIYDTIVTYATAHHFRRRKGFRVSANDKREARKAAQSMFASYRHAMRNTKNYVEAKIVRITVEASEIGTEIIQPDVPNVLDQIKALVGATVADARVGTKVSKTNGDYEFDGVVVGVVRKLSGAERFVVEDSRGLLLIMNAKQIGL